MGQVGVFALHKVLYGIIPLFEIQTCSFYPLLVSLWHIFYLLVYIVMFMRLIILEPDYHSRWIKVVGIIFIAIRFAVWPYELAEWRLQEMLMRQPVQLGATCWAEWGQGVIILNFLSDVLANLFLSGMFVRRLYLHILSSRTVMSRRNRVIEQIARKSLLCLCLTFIVNLAMSLLKVTTFIGNRSDALTVYFSTIESTLLVEALRVDYLRLNSQAFCEHCGMQAVRQRSEKQSPSSGKDDYLNVSLKMPDSMVGTLPRDGGMVNLADDDRLPSALSDHTILSLDPVLRRDNSDGFYDSVSAPSDFRHDHRPIKRTKADRESIQQLDPVSSMNSIRLVERPEWSNNEYRMF
ncbi:hypothetical protein BCR43DRAFT_559805 [Syncephalastrum racemosum]|uniref:Uncharacterized protein n=1 Tax=Syncephalastrum racemosum TaxID=13706 RepID=A0A1X2HU11_SYNRA|nr:hypothetical protein BCR43DRAFT_559805 [Syncephalastrum racemosum]